MAIFTIPEMRLRHVSPAEHTDSTQNTTLIDVIYSIVKPILECIASYFVSSSSSQPGQIPAYLRSYEDLQSFFSTSEALDRILEKANEVIPEVSALGFDDKPRLSSSHYVNRLNEKGESIKQTPPFSEEAINDQLVRKKLIRCETGEIKFELRGRGHCRGICQWFIYLYLHTKNQFSDSVTHLAAIQKEFKVSVGKEAALLQRLHVNKGKLLGLNIGTQSTGSVLMDFPLPSLEIDYAEWQPGTTAFWAQSTIEKLENMKPDVYFLTNHNHAMVYIKISPMLGFFFDPNRGIKEINGPQGKALHSLIPTTKCPGYNGTANKLNFYPVTVRA